MGNNTPDHDKKNMNQDTPETAAPMDFEYIIKNNMIENTLLSLADQQGVDIYECKINPFKALLQETGAILFPYKTNILKIKMIYDVNENVYNIKRYNYIYNIKYLYDIYNQYCYISHKYNKLISIMYYCYLCNIPYTTMYKILNTNSDYNYINKSECENFNQLRLYILKGLASEREENLKEKCFESPGAVGTIAIGNVENGWNLTPGQKAINTADNNILSLGQLPTLKAITTAENTENNGILAD